LKTSSPIHLRTVLAFLVARQEDRLSLGYKFGNHNATNHQYRYLWNVACIERSTFLSRLYERISDDYTGIPPVSGEGQEPVLALSAQKEQQEALASTSIPSVQ
jgi:hypothetical protein